MYLISSNILFLSKLSFISAVSAGVFPFFHDPVNINPLDSVFINGIARSNWVVEDQFDGIFGGLPEYHFIARIDSGGEIKSDLLRVVS